MSNTVAVATVVIALSTILYTVGTFRLLKATRDMFLLNFILAYRDAQRRGQLEAIEEKRASAVLNRMLERLFPDELKELRGTNTEGS